MTPRKQIAPSMFTPDEWSSLETLRTRYTDDRGHFTRREISRLLFARWLYRTGRLLS